MESGDAPRAEDGRSFGDACGVVLLALRRGAGERDASPRLQAAFRKAAAAFAAVGCVGGGACFSGKKKTD